MHVVDAPAWFALNKTVPYNPAEHGRVSIDLLTLRQTHHVGHVFQRSGGGHHIQSLSAHLNCEV